MAVPSDYWPVCGRTIATDEELVWDALADGVTRQELEEADAQAAFQISSYFELDMVHIPAARPAVLPRPVRTGKGRWLQDGMAYRLNERTGLVVLEHPSQGDADSVKIDENARRAQGEQWNGTAHEDVKPANYIALVNAYRRYCGFAQLPGL